MHQGSQKNQLTRTTELTLKQAHELSNKLQEVPAEQHQLSMKDLCMEEELMKQEEQFIKEFSPKGKSARRKCSPKSGPAKSSLNGRRKRRQLMVENILLQVSCCLSSYFRQNEQQLLCCFLFYTTTQITLHPSLFLVPHPPNPTHLPFYLPFLLFNLILIFWIDTNIVSLSSLVHYNRRVKSRMFLLFF